ncbi:transglycosylase domain-containing protein [Brevibacillus laterosporus]|uniref:transglycosylase domain-containing protein n=1 Tax=Brevibacillus laterosporus TaxID=1465 RepID=UPI000839D2D6|nr:PBP1A family penicillin-binding protein [Brevibacillus laterosporus]
MEVIREHPLLRWLRRVRLFIKILGLTMLAAALSILFLVLYLRSQPMPATVIHQTSTIYAGNGEIIDSIHRGENRYVVTLDNVSPYLVQATLSIEDRYFYQHMGIDLKRTAKAAYVNIVEMNKAQGASTITQQLARNLYLSHEKTWTRKAKEALLTLQLELNYTKDEILAMYMNQIYYGHSAYGAEAAAGTYFGKKAKDLTLAESSMLAGIPKGPTYYSPITNFDNAKKRQKLILAAMHRDGYISEKQMGEAYEQKLTFRSPKEVQKASIAPYFRDYILTLAKDKYGISEEAVQNGGLKIYTTLDVAIQKKAEEAIRKHMPKNNQELQIALVAIAPKTGFIKALVGGRDYKKSQFNRVLSKRQPGSTFKPIMYLSALDNGFTPLTLMKSEPTVFTYENGKEYVPSNYGNKFTNTFITMQEAISTSDNIYAVKTINQLTPQKIVDEAKKLGITSPLQAVPSLALGTSPISPLELTAAYSTIANNGSYITPVAILKIMDNTGAILAEDSSAHVPVADPSSSYVLNQMMQTVFSDTRGTAHRVAGQLNRPVAGKTGSTDYDSWIGGFTPQLVTSVWTGYDEGKKIDPIKDARLAAPLWAEFMESALNNQPPSQFNAPTGVVSVYIDPVTKKLATQNCPHAQVMYFKAGTEPQDYCSEHIPEQAIPDAKPPEKEKKSLWNKLWGR